MRGMLIIGLFLCMTSNLHAQALNAPLHAQKQTWSFQGPTGYFDISSVQRGYQIFAKKCASCHGLTQLHFSEFSRAGLKPQQIIELAKSRKMFDGLGVSALPHYRTCLPQDHFPAPYLTPEIAAHNNGGIMPPDLSRIIENYPGGADRLYAFLTSFPRKTQIRAPWRNPYVIGHLTYMPPPFTQQEMQSSAHQDARDVTTFLSWVSLPAHDTRRRFAVIAGFYLLFTLLLTTILKRRIWSHVK